MPRFQYQTQNGLVQEGGSDGKFTTDFYPQLAVSGSSNDFGTATSASIERPGVYSTSAASACTLTLPGAATCPGGIVIVQSTTVQNHIVQLLPNDEAGSGRIAIPTAAWDNTASTNGTAATLTASAAGETIQLVSDGVGWQVIGCQGTWTVA